MNLLIPPIREAILQRGCTDQAVTDALNVLPVVVDTDEADLREWLTFLGNLPQVERLAAMRFATPDLSYTLDA